MAGLTARAVEDLDVRVDVGAPDEVIVICAEESGADLLVIGVAGSDSEGSGLGATALRIARPAHCPVLVVRKSPAKGPILAATDLSDPAQVALAVASTVAAKMGEPLVALHVVDYSPVVVVPEAFGPGIPIPGFRGGAQGHPQGRGRPPGRGPRSTRHPGRPSGRGRPPDRIVAAAEQIEARLVVVGTAGGGGLRRCSLGSVAEDVLRLLAPCSVLLVRHHKSGGREQ